MGIEKFRDNLIILRIILKVIVKINAIEELETIKMKEITNNS